MNLLREKMRLLPMSGPQMDGGGGGGGGSQTSSQTQVADLPEWAKGYAQDVLSKGQALTDINQNPYQAYTQPRIADLSSLQKTAMGTVASPEAFGQTVQGYMSPYMQNVVDVQKRAAREQAGIQAGALNARAAQAGAFGGSGLALQRAAGQRDLARQLDEIQKMGSQAAFQQGVQQANTAIGQQTQLGALQQQQAQRPLDLAYQDFLTQKNYPYQQLSYMANLVRGTPMGMSTQSQVYQAPGSLTGQLAGLGLGAFGLSQMGLKFAEGGSVGGYADGGSVTDKFNDPSALLGEMDKLSDEQLQQILRSPVTAAEAQAAQQELAQRASERYGMSAAFNQLPADNQQNIIRAAGGGILAFAGNEKKQPGGGSWVPDPSSGELVWEPERRGLGEAIADLIGWKKGLEIDPLKDRPELKASLSREAAPQMSEAYARGQDSTDAEAGIPMRLPKAAPKQDKAAAHPAVQQARGIAEAAGDAGTFDSNFQKYMKELGGASAEQLKEIKGLLAKQMGEGEDIKKEGLGRALAAFGFNMAAQAAQPGVARRSGLAGLLQSAGAASPALYESVSETNRLARAAKDNALKMQVEMMKYETALKKGDQQTAAMLANNIEQRQLQQAQLAEQKRYHDLWASAAQARAGGNNRMEVEMFKAQGRAQTDAVRHVQNIMKEWGNRLPKEWKDKGYTSVEQVRPLLERHYTSRFLPGALSAVSESRARDISDNDVIDLAGG